MSLKNYIVNLFGLHPVQTSVAVIAESEREAEQIALERIDHSPARWVGLGLEEVVDHSVASVTEVPAAKLDVAIQKHLLNHDAEGDPS